MRRRRKKKMKMMRKKKKMKLFIVLNPKELRRLPSCSIHLIVIADGDVRQLHLEEMMHVNLEGRWMYEHSQYAGQKNHAACNDHTHKQQNPEASRQIQLFLVIDQWIYNKISRTILGSKF